MTKKTSSKEGISYQIQYLCVRIYINGKKEYAPELECNSITQPSVKLNLDKNIEDNDRRWIYSEYSQVLFLFFK